jgi:hypothetical protein
LKQTINSNLIGGTAEADRLQYLAFKSWQEGVQKKWFSWRAGFTLDSELLRPDVQDWLATHNTECQLTMRFAYKDDTENQEFDGVECITEIDIADPDVALLFKLAWGGV